MRSSPFIIAKMDIKTSVKSISPRYKGTLRVQKSTDALQKTAKSSAHI